MSSSLWLPPTVSRELQDQTNEHKAQVWAEAVRDATLDYWDAELKKIDEDLFMIKAADDATAAGLRPGYYHVIRRIAGGPPAILPIVGDEGEFVEPTSRLLDVLREGDLQNPRAMEARRRKDEEAARRRVRDKERAHDERVEEMVERLKAATQTRVSMNRDTPWSQNVAGRKRRAA